MIGSKWRVATHTHSVINPYNQEVLAEVSLAGTSDIDEAIALAVKAFDKTRTLPTYMRSRICLQIAQGIEDKQ
jgi:acyl-CoA reductase-like NAD-dependent aldehyde dehydrogenase